MPATPVSKGASQMDFTPIKRANLNAGCMEFHQNIKSAISPAASSLRGSSLTKVATLSNAQITEIMLTATKMRKLVTTSGGDDFLKGKILATVFYEPSTRTNCSFQAAMMRQGGQVICVNESSSSAVKGETLSDTVRSLECYCDVIVLRHPRSGAAAEAAAAMSKPLFNAGDGVGEHPTQALLDLFTIIDELCGDVTFTTEEELASALRGKVVTMVGDLKNGRTVHSLSKLLGRFDVSLRYVSPASLRMPEYVKEEAASNGGAASHTEHDMLTPSLIGEADILYITRVQKERFETEEAYEAVKGSFIITPATLEKMKATARIMHPLPRVNEIDHACDADPRAAYFRQMTNGMYVRMALLRLVFG